MSMSESKAANAIGGKTARACDSCLLKRARWYCTADDAFLCQACDASVHSANQLASRHERVRLETSSFKSNKVINSSTPTWHQGFTRKARTPRQPKSTLHLQPPLPLVPEINTNEDVLWEENEEQLLYRVPVFDPFADDEFFMHEMVKGEEEVDDDNHDLNLEDLLMSGGRDVEFAGDVENLFETGQDGINIDHLDNCEIELEHISTSDVLGGKTAVKVEEDDDDGDGDEVQAVIACHFDPALDMELNWDFDDYASHSSITINGEEGDHETKQIIDVIHETAQINHESEQSQVKRKMLLRLNYDAVIAAWGTQCSPWTNGIRPHFNNLDQFMDACFADPYGGVWGRSGNNDTAGREARVSRYREKRRTRLFSKKIRYQVRKLNAEKRPRMKGRFVKRTNFSVSNALPYLVNKC